VRKRDLPTIELRIPGIGRRTPPFYRQVPLFSDRVKTRPEQYSPFHRFPLAGRGDLGTQSNHTRGNSWGGPVGADDSLELAGPPVGPPAAPQNANGEIALAARTYVFGPFSRTRFRETRSKQFERSCLWGDPVGSDARGERRLLSRETVTPRPFRVGPRVGVAPPSPDEQRRRLVCKEPIFHPDPRLRIDGAIATPAIAQACVPS
jgi:hypothetical protein